MISEFKKEFLLFRERFELLIELGAEARDRNNLNTKNLNGISELSEVFNTFITLNIKEKSDIDLHWSTLCKANYFIGELKASLLLEAKNSEIDKIITEAKAMALSEQARNAVKIKLDKDLKQSEKLIVRECWENWQKSPSQYKNKTKFATAMIEKFRPDDPDDEDKHLNSVKVITDWCAEWAKEM